MDGKITITEVEDLKVHTYTSPDNGWSVNSHIIELPTQLFVIDAQLLIPYGKEVADYATEIGKPITRLYITHHHPDHFFGASAFNIKISTLAETARMIATVGDTYASAMHSRLGNIVPANSPKPEIMIKPGKETIEGIEMELIHLKSAETEDALVIAFPGYGILITQDLLYHHIHPYLGDKAFNLWADNINRFKQSQDYNYILPGHGGPGGIELFDLMLNYLTSAEDAYNKSEDFSGFVRRITLAMPLYHNRALLSLSERYLFPKNAR